MCVYESILRILPISMRGKVVWSGSDFHRFAAADGPMFIIDCSRVDSHKFPIAPRRFKLDCRDSVNPAWSRPQPIKLQAWRWIFGQFYSSFVLERCFDSKLAQCVLDQTNRSIKNFIWISNAVVQVPHSFTNLHLKFIFANLLLFDLNCLKSEREFWFWILSFRPSLSLNVDSFLNSKFLFSINQCCFWRCFISSLLCLTAFSQLRNWIFQARFNLDH